MTTEKPKISFTNELKEITLNILKNEKFTDDDHKRLRQCKKILKKLKYEKDIKDLEKFKERQKTLKHEALMKELFGSGVMMAIVDGFRDKFTKKSKDKEFVVEPQTETETETE